MFRRSSTRACTPFHNGHGPRTTVRVCSSFFFFARGPPIEFCTTCQKLLFISILISPYVIFFLSCITGNGLFCPSMSQFLLSTALSVAWMGRWCVPCTGIKQSIVVLPLQSLSGIATSFFLTRYYKARPLRITIKSVLVAKPKKLLHTVAKLARGLLD